MRYLDPVLREHGAAPTGPAEQRPVGWGNVKYTVARYTTTAGEVTMVGLPHLSPTHARCAVERLNGALSAARGQLDKPQGVETRGVSTDEAGPGSRSD